SGTPVFLIGHVTKDGAIAGPRTLEHIVDTVLYCEGEKSQAYRILRAVKNRFGSTNEIGVFEMTDAGLKEVANPSAWFLSERPQKATGSVVVASLEGTRPILIELQALVSPTSFPMPRRRPSWASGAACCRSAIWRRCRRSSPWSSSGWRKWDRPWMRCSPNLTRTFFSTGLGLVLLAGCARAPVIPSAPLTVTAEELVILL